VNTPAPLSVDQAEHRVLGWQRKLHRWAGEDAGRRFDDIHNLVCDPATLLVAWERVKRNRGSKTAGVDGQTRASIERRGVERTLSELGQALKDRTYAPQPVREHMIAKRGGKTRSLGIPALRDRIVQMAAKLVLEPIFEADFCPTSYGFRPRRRARDAVAEVALFVNPPRSYEWVIEGDVEDCFGSIHHGLLMAKVRRRVTDKRVLGLIRQFLAAGIMREQGPVATPSGTPQGAILSPLLANVALSVLDRHFEAAWTSARNRYQRAQARAKGQASYRLVRYADDFVVLVRGSEAQAQALKERTAEFLRDELRLTLSPEKTHITHVDAGFDFLGFRILRKARPGRKPAAYIFPNQRAFGDVKHRIKELTRPDTTYLSLDELIHALNPVLRGWTNYFREAASARAFSYLSHYLWWRVMLWLRKKYPRLTWKQIKRKYWGRRWSGPNGARLVWPADVPVTKYTYRGHHITSPWATPATNEATSQPEAAGV